MCKLDLNNAYFRIGSFTGKVTFVSSFVIFDLAPAP